MPVTPAHAVFAPFVDRWTGGRLPLSAVAAGCVAPDVEYFLRLDSTSRLGHSPLGVLAWDLPVALVMLAVFHGLLRDRLPLLLPDAHRARLATLPPWRWRERPLGVVVAIVLGAATHLALDSCTHVGGFSVERVELLRAEVAGVPVFSWLQYGLGGGFLLVLAACYALWFRRTPASAEPAPGLSVRARLAAWAALGAFAAALGAWNAQRLVGHWPPVGRHEWSTAIAGAAFAAHTAAALFAGAFSLAVSGARGARRTSGA